MKRHNVTLEPSAEPIVHPPRSVPVNIRELYRQEIDKMLELGVITRVGRHTHRLGK